MIESYRSTVSWICSTLLPGDPDGVDEHLNGDLWLLGSYAGWARTRDFKPEPLQRARGKQVRQLRFERIWGPKPLVYGLK
jgi:hypothetical protein